MFDGQQHARAATGAIMRTRVTVEQASIHRCLVCDRTGLFTFGRPSESG
jgi:hypothetical protein